MSMGTKLLVAPLVCLLFMIVSGGVSFLGMRVQQSSLQEMHAVRFANYAKVETIMNDADGFHTTLYRLLTSFCPKSQHI